MFQTDNNQRQNLGLQDCDVVEQQGMVSVHCVKNYFSKFMYRCQWVKTIKPIKLAKLF